MSPKKKATATGAEMAKAKAAKSKAAKQSPANDSKDPKTDLGGSTLTSKRLLDGRYRLKLDVPGAPPHVGTVRIMAQTARAAFINKAKKKFPGLDAEELEREIDEIAGAEADNLEARSDDSPEIRSSPTYKHQDGKMYLVSQTNDGPQLIEVASFLAKVEAVVRRSDGLEESTLFRMGATYKARSYTFELSAQEFHKMDWSMEHIAASASVAPKLREHARAAIQSLSQGAITVVKYTHTGWRKIDNKEVYLHAGGGFGEEWVEVDLPRILDPAVLPAPLSGTDLAGSWHSIKRFLDLAPDRVTVPILGALGRVLLGECDFGLHLHGGSGVFKTELAAVGQSFHGRGFDSRHLPANWSSTENSLEGTACMMKDMLCVIDDFAPSGTRYDVERYHAKAERLFRAQGNRGGRGRMTANAELRPTKFPRGVILSTGEEVPVGHSLRARMLVLELSPGDIKGEDLTPLQGLARRGEFDTFYASMIGWLAPGIEQKRKDLPARVEGFRAEFSAGGHLRTPELAANLFLGVELILEFAMAQELCDEAEATELLSRTRLALMEASMAQRDTQRESEPVELFFELLQSALSSGRAHINAPSGGCPVLNPSALGWESDPESPGQMKAHGDRIGWVDGDGIYLDFTAAFKAAQGMAIGSSSIPITEQTLRKRIAERGLLASQPEANGRFTVQRTFEKSRHRVLHLKSLSGAASGVGVDPVADAAKDDFKGSSPLTPLTPLIEREIKIEKGRGTWIDA